MLQMFEKLTLVNFISKEKINQRIKTVNGLFVMKFQRLFDDINHTIVTVLNRLPTEVHVHVHFNFYNERKKVWFSSTQTIIMEFALSSSHFRHDRSVVHCWKNSLKFTLNKLQQCETLYFKYIYDFMEVFGS